MRRAVTHICERCGIERVSRYGRETVLCRDCQNLPIAHLDASRDVLSGGEWVYRAGRHVWVEHRCHCGELLTGRSCETCLRWAEKDARLHSEARQRWANRRRIWDVLELRKERENAA